MPTIKVFLSYCRQDTDTVMPLFGTFKGLLKSFTHNKQTYKIEYYWDAQNVPGIEWDHNIKWWLKSADVIVFFVTQNFLNSGYIQGQEIPIALERMESAGIHLLPVLMEDCDFQQCAISHLQFIPNKNNRLLPYSEWKNKKEFKELVRFALKLSLKNSVIGHPHHKKFHPDVLTPAERKIYEKLFLPPEIRRLSRIGTRKKKAKKEKGNMVSKIKSTLLKWFK